MEKLDYCNKKIVPKEQFSTHLLIQSQPQTNMQKQIYIDIH